MLNVAFSVKTLEIEGIKGNRMMNSISVGCYFFKNCPIHATSVAIIAFIQILALCFPESILVSKQSGLIVEFRTP